MFLHYICSDGVSSLSSPATSRADKDKTFNWVGGGGVGGGGGGASLLKMGPAIKQGAKPFLPFVTACCPGPPKVQKVLHCRCSALQSQRATGQRNGTISLQNLSSRIWAFSDFGNAWTSIINAKMGMCSGLFVYTPGFK